MNQTYLELLTSIVQIKTAGAPRSANDIFQNYYQYTSETTIPDLPLGSYLRLIGSGSVDLEQPLSFSMNPIDGFLILDFVRGGVQLKLAHASYDVRDNMILVVNCKDFLELRTVIFPCAFHLYFLSGPALRGFCPFVNSVYLACKPEVSTLATRITMLNSFPTTADPALLLKMHCLLTNILSEVSLSFLSDAPTANANIPAYLLSLHEYILNLEHRSFSLEVLEKRYGISRYRLCREYQKFYHISPLKHFNQVRINEAKKLLLTTNLQVQEISSKVGYENVNHFIHLFKAATKETPKSFRIHSRL